MFLVDFETERIVPDDEIKEKIASSNPYGEWNENGIIDLEKWTEDDGMVHNPFDFSLTNTKQPL